MKSVLLVPLLVLATGCPFFSQQHRQVGLVPPPRPMVYDGQTMSAPIRIEGRAATVVGPREQVDPADASQHSAYVARDVIGGSLFGLKGETELGLSYDHVFARGAAPMSPDAASQRIPSTDGHAVTVSARRSIKVDNAWAVGLAGDLGWTRVPISRSDGEQLSNTAALYRVGIVPSYKSGSLTVFASMQLTNDIVVPSLVTVSSYSDVESEVSAGGAALIPSLGASVRFDNGVKLTTQIAKPFNTAIDHGPQIELAFGYEFGGPSVSAPR